MDPNTPEHLDLQRDRGLAIRWRDGHASFYPIAYLRRMSPSADMRQLRGDMERNPLTVLPNSAGTPESQIRATDAELVGNYAIRIVFSDGHRTGVYSWSYLREIDPETTRLRDDARREGGEPKTTPNSPPNNPSDRA